MVDLRFSQKLKIVSAQTSAVSTFDKISASGMNEKRDFLWTTLKIRNRNRKTIDLRFVTKEENKNWTFNKRRRIGRKQTLAKYNRQRVRATMRMRIANFRSLLRQLSRDIGRRRARVSVVIATPLPPPRGETLEIKYPFLSKINPEKAEFCRAVLGPVLRRRCAGRGRCHGDRYSDLSVDRVFSLYRRLNTERSSWRRHGASEVPRCRSLLQRLLLEFWVHWPLARVRGQEGRDRSD